MKEQIKLEEIVGYLPYGLKLRVRLNRFSRGPLGKMYTDKTIEFTFKNISKLKPGVHYTSIKPILRPLSSLTEKDCMYYELINVVSILCGQSSEYILRHTCYKDIETLYKYHFDIHNLIERGLAIDINTLGK
jgi:hypothetical protein